MCVKCNAGVGRRSVFPWIAIRSSGRTCGGSAETVRMDEKRIPTRPSGLTPSATGCSLDDVADGDASMPVSQEELHAALARATRPACPQAIMPLMASTSGGSGAFLVRADDGKRYWCKCIQSPQGPRVALNEQIVGRLGRAIQAAVCDVTLLEIPPSLEGWEFRPGQRLVAGYVHGSLAVETPVEIRAISHPNDDENPTRLTTLRVLADWCWAGDYQWLYAPSDENRYFSHDHGHYFPGGPAWTIASLQASDPLSSPPGLDRVAFGPTRRGAAGRGSALGPRHHTSGSASLRISRQLARHRRRTRRDATLS